MSKTIQDSFSQTQETCILLDFMSPNKLHTFVCLSSAKSLQPPAPEKQKKDEKKIDLVDYLWLHLAASLITDLPSVPSTVVRTKT